MLGRVFLLGSFLGFWELELLLSLLDRRVGFPLSNRWVTLSYVSLGLPWLIEVESNDTAT